MALKKQNSFPHLVAFIVTSKCIANCDICISGINTKDLDTTKAKEVISKAVKAGAKIISFAGREPFMRKDIFNLVKHAKDLGVCLSMETNWILLNDARLKKLSSYGLDWISFSLDSLNKELCEKMGRPFSSKNRLSNIIKLCRKYNIKLKISSVISDITKNEIEEIGGFLIKNPPTIWKLRQFTPRSFGYQVRKKYKISNNEFQRILKKIKVEFSSLKVEGKTSAQQTGTCFLVFSDGQIVRPHGGGFISCGNILEQDIKKIWQRRFSKKKRKLHYNNFARTYIK